MTSKQEFNCVFCKDVFENKEDLQEHFRKHGDPNYKNRTEVDPQASDEKSREKVEIVSCDVCSQVFPTISKAITHKHKVHPDHDAKYFCPWCGKLFTMKHLYNVHVQSTHADQQKTEEKCFQCDSCSVDFFIPSAMINHNKFFHRQDTDLPDVGQSKKIKYYKQEYVPIYYCSFCGEEYENKVNLIKHISDDHEDENQTPEEVLKCPMCEAVFYHLDAYEIHLTFHTSEDMYSVQNSEFNDLLDYSLETLPPIIEKVTNVETEDYQDTDAESAMNAVGIEKFLELAMDQSEDHNTVKVKKHKKHKKSKKAAITLDEFLSMNKDVFGEGLDFQGIEEVPTRVVKKQLKNNKKSINSVVTSAELDKLKKAGIVVKRKVERIPLEKSIKVATLAPNKSALHKPVYKINKVREIETSSEVLSKLMNQSNSQIKIVKKVNPNTQINEPNKIIKDLPPKETEEIQGNVKENTAEVLSKLMNQSNSQIKIVKKVNPHTPVNEPNKIIKDLPPEETEEIPDNVKENTAEPNNTAGEQDTPIPKSDDDNTHGLPSPKSKVLSVTDPSKDQLSQSKFNSTMVTDSENTENNSDKMKETSNMQNSNHSPKPVQNEMYQEISNTEDTEQDNNERNKFDDSDTELENTENKSENDNNTKTEKTIDSSRVPTNHNSDQDNVLSTSASSLSTLKHLGHLTVKSIGSSQNKSDLLTEPTINEKIIVKDSQNSKNDRQKEISDTLLTDKLNSNKQKTLVEKDSTMDALKALGKNITIKSLSSKRNIDVSEPEDDEIDEYEATSNLKLEDISGNKNITIKKIKVESSESKSNTKVINSLHHQDRQCIPGKQMIGQKIVNKMPRKITVEKTDNSVSSSNANILKRLTNVTTKSIVNKANYPSPVTKQDNLAKKVLETENKQEEIIEIFDIDDSEDEDDINSKPQPSEHSIKSMDALKNLSKNITVKSLNQQSVKQNVKIENNIKLEKEDSNSRSKFKAENNDDLINMQNRNLGVQNVLQGLCKNITIKSRNTTSSQFVKSQENVTEDFKFEDDDEAGSDISENIKITELDEDMDDSEDNSEMPEKLKSNPIVESPHDSCSDNEHFDEDIHDFETDIKVSTVQKCNQTTNSTINSMYFNNLKNINKNITIKSINKNLADDDRTKQANNGQETSRIQNKTIQTKTARQVGQELANDNTSINRISKIVDHTQPLNKKISAMNQISKEVTVKTIETKTVIQEITTTVTKTIKTVNQTMQQEVRNTIQSNKPVVPQRIQGMKPGPSTNLQGVVIRHAPPVIGARASNTITQIRPAKTVVRPSKQNVPIRPRMNPVRPNNTTRPNNPTIAIGRKVIPPPTPNKPMIARPLKVSPSAMAAGTAKRLNTEDVSGPFSCFKKPKESLIPVSDIPTFGNSSGVTAFTSASHTSSSNFTSTTKVVKGNSVVSAKQVKSEVNATSQQFSRLNNATGIKIMTSQQKQSQVHEKSESSPMKRTTLEAIQRLQKQGLLVKKPRTDVSEDNEDSDHDGDDNVRNSSADEHDE